MKLSKFEQELKRKEKSIVSRYEKTKITDITEAHKQMKKLREQIINDGTN